MATGVLVVEAKVVEEVEAKVVASNADTITTKTSIVSVSVTDTWVLDSIAVPAILANVSLQTIKINWP